VKAALRTLFCSRLARVLWPLVAGMLALAILIHAEGWSLRWPVESSKAAAPKGKPPRPDEFLYLDSERALAYLAQMQGGTTTGEAFSERLNKTIGGKLALAGLEANGSRAEEDLTERQVTPTGASSYVELVKALEEAGELHHPTLRCFQCRDNLSEGEFVLFRTNAARPPIYANPYLAVKQSVTLSALFPTGGTNASNRSEIISERGAARKFASQVGEDPRIVFDLRLRREHGESREYLLPVSYRQLTSERSLIKYGGGSFTVLGKVVRIFPERGQTSEEEERDDAYVDSATRETWRRPLENAIPRLICSSDPVCVKRTRNADLPKRERAIAETRNEMEEALRKQTEIESRGAVILPIAIYK
jgi:hypothetical protein